jgi:hypothetical protein
MMMDLTKPDLAAMDSTNNESALHKVDIWLRIVILLGREGSQVIKDQAQL